MVVVSLGPGKPTVCRTDEVGELCIAADYTGTGYWGLRGQTGSQFCVQPVHEDGRQVSVVATTAVLPMGAPPNPPAGPTIASTVTKFVRSGLIGFPGPASSVSLKFLSLILAGILSC